MRKLQIHPQQDKITSFCKRWKIKEFSLFGSILRDDFGPKSDVDVLISFDPKAEDTFDHRLQMVEELKEMFGRPVDLVVKDNLRNPFRRYEILSTREVIYEAA